MSVARRLVALLVLGLGQAISARAGERIDFTRSITAPVALPQHEFKSVVAQLLDGSDGQLGRAASHVLASELLDAVGDVPSAAVLLALSTSEEPVTKMLEADYHSAALEIARHQQARMAMWGAVTHGAGGRDYLDLYVTLVPEITHGPLKIEMRVGGRPLGIAAEVPRTRFHFATVEITNEELFQRPLHIRRALPLHAQPNETSPVIRNLGEGEVVRMRAIVGDWAEVVDGGAVAGYVRHDLNATQLPPIAVRIDKAVRLDPLTGAKRLGVSPGRYVVLDERYVTKKGVQYLIAALEGSGWMPASAATPEYSTPAIQFLAGLYRYQARKFEDAARDFDRFISLAGSEEEDAVVATAYQLKGASELLANPTEASRPVPEAFTKAIEHTPFDPACYTLRAVASMQSQGRVNEECVLDLQRSLELDARNARARDLVVATYSLREETRPEFRAFQSSVRGFAADSLQTMMLNYSIGDKDRIRSE